MKQNNIGAQNKVGVVAGDGIGSEVVTEGLKVVEAAGVKLETVPYDLGGARYLKDGTVLPDSVLEEWRGLDALYFGAVGAPGVPPGVIERGLLLRMRFELDLYVNLRPFRFPERNIDMVVVRENTEGTYAGEGGFLRQGTAFEIATQGSVNTRHGVERCVRFACGLAQSRPAHHLTLVHIAGQMIADPTAAILSAAMMLDFLGETAAAAAIQTACDQIGEFGKQAESQTKPTLSGTAAIGDAIAQATADIVAGHRGRAQ